MRKVFLFEQSDSSVSISNKLYGELMTFIESRCPEAESLAEDEELCQLQWLWVLLRQKQLRLEFVDSNLGMFYLLEVLEEGQEIS